MHEDSSDGSELMMKRILCHSVFYVWHHALLRIWMQNINGDVLASTTALVSSQCSTVSSITYARVSHLSTSAAFSLRHDGTSSLFPGREGIPAYRSQPERCLCFDNLS